MKKIQTLASLAFALAATITLASCSNEETGNSTDGDGTTAVKISFSYAEDMNNTNTRAEGAAATAEEASFQPGHIFFVTGSGMIDTHVTIKPSGGDFTVDELEDGEVVVEGVSSSATHCYILSNDAAVFTGTDALSTNLKGTNISQVLAKKIAVGAMNNSPSTLANVPMYGVGDVDIDDAGTTVGSKEYTATVDVDINSLASRIQIGKFTAEDYTVGTDVVKIKSFTVDGIYINNTFDKMTFASVVDATPEINNDSDVAKYSKTVGTTSYITTGTANTLADEPALPAALDGTVLTADQTVATNVWAYNVFPKGLPHIIVKLSNITYTITSGANPEGAVQTITGSQWLTINSYHLGATSGASDTALAAFEANNIYTLGNIAFSFNDLTDIPYTQKLDVLVTVDMFNWVDTPIHWNH